MYKIDSKVDKPDLDYMRSRLEKMMQDGITVGNVLGKYRYYKNKQEEIAEVILNSYGIENVNSPKQVTRYLQNLEDDIVYEVCYIDGKWTSNKEAMGILSDMGYGFATSIMEFRKVKRYAEACKSLIDAMGDDKRVRPTVSFGKTNRVNYSSPALMNIPKELLWELIKPSEDGNILFTADIKNQEPSILINMLGVEDFKGALTDPRGLYETLFNKPFEVKAKLNVWVVPPDTDANGIWENSKLAEKQGIPPIYYSPYKLSTDVFFVKGKRILALEALNTVTDIGKEPIYPDKIIAHTEDGDCLTLPVKFEKIDNKHLGKHGVYEVAGIIDNVEVVCDSRTRNEFKIAWNAMTYGASAFGIKKMCKHIDGEAVYKYFSRIPEFKAYRQQCTKLANQGVQRINTFFGTPLHANESNSKVLKRVLMDLPIQGTGSDILALLIKHFDTEVEKRDLKDKLWIYFTRHDELIIEASNELVGEIGIDAIINIIRDIVEHQIDDWVPFKVEIDLIDNHTNELISL